MLYLYVNYKCFQKIKMPVNATKYKNSLENIYLFGAIIFKAVFVIHE